MRKGAAKDGGGGGGGRSCRGACILEFAQDGREMRTALGLF